MALQRRILLFTAITMALAMSTAAFVIQPSTTTIAASSAIYSPQFRNANHGSGQLFLLNNNNYNDGDHDLREDWQTFTKAAGDIARNLGGKLAHAIQQGGSKLKDLATQSVEKVKSALLPAADENQTVYEDTQDEDLFRSLFSDDNMFVAASESSVMSVYEVMDQAAAVLVKDETVDKLLGPFLQYGQPFSQSSWSSSVNGKSTTTLRASFEVWGTKGQGVASVSATDGALISLDLQVHGLHYSLNTSPRSSTSQQSKAEDDGAIEVEVLEGIRIPGRRRGDYVDAEILEKTVW